MSEDPILDAFDQRRELRPEAPIVVSRSRQATVADVDRLARGVFGLLERNAGRPGALVGLAAPNGTGFLAGLLAVRRAGGAALLFDGRAPAAEKARIATGLGATALLECDSMWPADERDFSLIRMGGERDGAELAPETAVVKLTSGSTGCPRGILTPSAALVADDAALATSMGLADDERILAAIPMSHSYGLSSVVMPALLRGSVLVLPEECSPFEPMVAARALGATFLPTAPAYLQALVRTSRPPRAPSSLRLVISAGAPLQPSTAVRFREVYGRSVHVFYGASECGGISYDRTGTAGERGSLGTPVDGVEITLEPVPGEECPERGTVTVTSPAVAAGYLPRAEPCLTGDCFRTRDVAVFRRGELVLEGRLDDLINVKGKKVNPREVESVLAALEGVEDVVALGVTLPGCDQRIVRAFVACRPGRLSVGQVRDWCRRHLADHKVPRSVLLLEEIPRTARGKPDRAALLELEPPCPPRAGRAAAGHG